MGEGTCERVPCPNLFSISTPTGSLWSSIGPPFYQTWGFCWHRCITVSKIIPLGSRPTVFSGCQWKYSSHGELLWAQLLLHVFSQLLFNCGKILIFKSSEQDVLFQLCSHRWFFLDICWKYITLKKENRIVTYCFSSFWLIMHTII